MAKNLKASLIVDLLGNISAKSRQWSQELGAFSRSGSASFNGLGNAVRRTGQNVDITGSRMSRTFTGMRSGIRAITSDFDRLQGSITGTLGRISNLYGMLAGGAAAYGFNKAFLRPASEMENYILRLNAINHGDTAKTEDVRKWAVQNAKETTWGLAGVMQEYASSRGFGMSDKEARNFITMLQDQGGYHGWSLADAQGASLQLKQMYSRGAIQAADANILTGYGINVYQLLAEKLKVDQKVLRDLGGKGKLGPDSIRLLFQVMAEQAKGAQKNAMNSWTGMTAMMGDVWDDFARDVMAKGPFDSLKNSLKGFLDYADEAKSSGLQEKLAAQTAGALNQGFEYARDAATGFYRAIQKVRETLQALRDAGYGDALDGIARGAQTAAKYLLYMYLATRALKLVRAVGGSALRLGATPLRWGISTASVLTSPFRKPQMTVPESTQGRGGRFLNFLTGVNPAVVQPVNVMNWPAGIMAGGIADVVSDGDRKRRRGRTSRGTGRGRPVMPVIPAPVMPQPASPTQGFFGRMMSRAGGLLSSVGNRLGLGRFSGLLRSPLTDDTRTGNISSGDTQARSRRKRGPGRGRDVNIPLSTSNAALQSASDSPGIFGRIMNRVGGLLSSAGNRPGLGRFTEFFRRAGGIAGRVGGGALWAGAMAAPVLLDRNSTATEKGEAVGALAGSIAGGALGAAAGPVGVAIGSTVGSYLGNYLGGWLTDAWQKLRGDTDNGSGKAAEQASARVELVAPDGWSARSIDINETSGSSLDVDVWNGGNYVRW
ncbi:tape measure protein [Escherichia coli]|uniref:tape measure protein n=1 Tax=Escherichia coli TaxID=562 RepID=UPI00201B0769|nr:tape measure protein [Escherichia coli]MEC6669123.1 tape measure protein [Escherichia coli]